MTIRKYFNIRKEIEIQQQFKTFLKYVIDISKVYPQFNQMTLGEIYENLHQKETAWELKIQKDLKVENYD